MASNRPSLSKLFEERGIIVNGELDFISTSYIGGYTESNGIFIETKLMFNIIVDDFPSFIEFIRSNLDNPELISVATEYFENKKTLHLERMANFDIDEEDSSSFFKRFRSLPRNFKLLFRQLFTGR